MNLNVKYDRKRGNLYMAKTGNFSKQMAAKKRDVAKDLKSVEYNGAVETKDDYLAELSMLMNLGKEKQDTPPVETFAEEAVTTQSQVQAGAPEVTDMPADVPDTKIEETHPVAPVEEEKTNASAKSKTGKKETTSKSTTKKDTSVKHAMEEMKSAPVQEPVHEKTVSPDDSVKKNVAQSEELPSTEEPKTTSMKRKLPTEKSTHCQRNNCCTWNCTVKPECESKFVYEAAVQGTTMMELINRIVYAEMEWQKQHPEFPSKEFVLNNIKNRKAIKHSRQEHVSMSIIFSPGAWDFVKIASKRCGMHMNVFLEFLIDEYCVS